MSAYLVNPEHIGALAGFAANTSSCVVYDWRNDADQIKTVRRVAEELAKANLLSIKARYGPKSAPEFAGSSEEQYIDDCQAWAEYYFFQPAPLTALDIYRMCECFIYQSCEYTDWSESTAHNQIEWIRSASIRQIPGYAEATRDHQERRPVPDKANGPVLLSSLLR